MADHARVEKGDARPREDQHETYCWSIGNKGMYYEDYKSSSQHVLHSLIDMGSLFWTTIGTIAKHKMDPYVHCKLSRNNREY